jgi:predicted RNA-binding protein with PUA-like domain
VPGIYGLATVASTPYPDPTQFDAKSDYFDPKSSPKTRAGGWSTSASSASCLGRFQLDELRSHADALDDFVLLRRGTRLSVLPVTAAQWKHILTLEKQRP